MTRAQRVLICLAVIAFTWAAAVALTGGFRVDWTIVRFSSRDWSRPALAGIALVAAYLIKYRPSAVAQLRPDIVAVACAVVAFVVGVGWGTFLGSGPDASGYVSQAEMWSRGELTIRAADWAPGAPWANAMWSSAPVGWRGWRDESMSSSALVPIYSPGFPLMMAVFQKVGGRDAVFYVVPLLGALAVWSTFLLGRQIAGPWAGALAAVFLVSSPPFLWFVIQPMSDVAVTAWWTVALLFAWRRTKTSAVLAGAASAAAIVVRPNLAPLAIIVGLVAAIDGRFELRRLLLVLAAAAPGALVVAALNWYWHGSLLRSGYGTVGQLYSTDYMWLNLPRYFTWLVDCQTPLVFAGFATPFLLWRRARARLPLAILSFGFPLMVFGAYVVWVVVDSWVYLRFLLPAFPVMFVGMGAALIAGTERFHRSALAVGTAAVLTVFVVFNGWEFVQGRGLFQYAQHDQRFARAVAYANGLAPEAVLVSLTYSGTLSFYTGRSVLVWEVLGVGDLDPALAYLRASGHPLYFIGDGFEVDYFKRKFAGTHAVETLDAHFITGDAGFVVYDMTLY
jgi:hypothetical protein